MPNSTHLYGQLFDFLRQYSRASDLRHHKALAWMVSALVCSGQLSLPAWEPYVPSRATKAQSVERFAPKQIGCLIHHHQPGLPSHRIADETDMIRIEGISLARRRIQAILNGSQVI